MDELSAQAILNGLRSSWLGRNVLFHEKTDSTNSVAVSLAQQGAPEGTLVIADEQTAGRGRLGRPWVAPHGTCLLFSLLFRPSLEARRAQGLTMVCGLGLRQAVRDVTGLPAQLKWPNDLLLHDRKAGGMLTELSAQVGRLDYVVVGIGLNVNVDAAQLPPQFHAASLLTELGRSVSRVQLLQRALEDIEARYHTLQAGLWPLQEWSAALDTLGKQVQLNTAEGVLDGQVEGVDEQGALLVRQDDGRVQRVLEGDIVLAGHSPER